MGPEVGKGTFVRRRRFVFVVSSGASVPFVQPLVRELEGRGHDAIIFAGQDELGTSPARPGDDYQLVDVLDRRVALPDPAALRRFRKAIRKQAADVVIPATPKAMLVTAIATRATPVDLLLWFWGLPSESAMGATRVVLGCADRFSLSSCEAAWFNSRSLRDAAAARHPRMARKMIYTAPGTTHGLAHRFLEAGAVQHTKSGPMNVGFVGRLASDKGIDGLVSSFVQRVDPSAPQCELVLVGPVDDRDPISHTTLNTIAAHPRIRWIGPVQDTLPYYRQFDVLAFPSRREGFPNAPLEAAAVGVPTVGFDATGTRDAVVEGSGILVPQDDWCALWAAIDGLSDATVRQTMGDEARHRVASCFQQHGVVAAHARFLEQWTSRRSAGEASIRDHHGR